jgi:hypothetical protein
MMLIMFVSMFVTCWKLRMIYFCMWLFDFLGNFRVCYRVRVTRRVRITRRVQVWNYFFTRIRVRVTRQVKFCGYGYGWALPVGYVPVAILRPNQTSSLLLGVCDLSWVGMKTVRIFSDCIRDRIRLEGFNPSVSESGYLTSDTVSVSEYLNHVFMMSISNRILSGIFYTIRIRIRIRTWIWKQIRY